MANVTVNLYAADGTTLLKATTTDSTGRYLFSGLAQGQYIVEVVKGTTLAGYNSSTHGPEALNPSSGADNDDNGTDVTPARVRSTPVTLTPGAAPINEPDQILPLDVTDTFGSPPAPTPDANRNLAVDFGFYRLVVGNQVWLDSDNSGTINGSELAVGNLPPPGIKLELYKGGVLVAETATDNAGQYRFDRRTVGPAAGDGLAPGDDYEVCIAASEFAPGGQLIDFASSNGPNGAYEPAPAPTSGPASGVDSDDNGTRMARGICTERLTLAPQPEGTTAAGATGQNSDGTTTNPTVDFGLTAAASLGDRVWLDGNTNGIQDEGEPGVPGVTVNLRSGAGDLLDTTTTGPDGRYNFTNLAPGDYQVEFGLPSGYARSPQNQGADDSVDSDADPNTGRTAVITLRSGEDNQTSDAGISFLASLGDRGWLDRNANGVQDSGEPGAPGVTVTLFGAATNTPVGAPVQTDTNGNYSFTVEAGRYYLVFTPPPGYQISPQNQGEDDTADSDGDPTGRTPDIDLEAGMNDPSWDLGLYQTLGLGNLVWNDVNNNGLVDGGEPGIPNVVVNLYRDVDGNSVPDEPQASPFATMPTGQDGSYRFDNLAPGSYIVQIIPPAGYTSSTGANGQLTGPYEGPATPGPNNDVNNDDNGSASTIGGYDGVLGKPITLTLGAEPDTPVDGDGANGNLTLDFGLFQPASLGSTVWADTNANGVRDEGEPGVGGVTVTLYNSTGASVGAATTGSDGIYGFTNLRPGSYRVGFSNLPAGLTFTRPNQGDNDGQDSDVDPATGLTGPVTLVPGQNNPTIWAGLVTPTAIRLASFTAGWEGGALVVRWETTAEVRTQSFYLLRSSSVSRADAVRVTPERIPARGRGAGGATYTWADPAARQGVSYAYWLVEVEQDGTEYVYGPARPAGGAQAGTRVYVPLVGR